MGRNAMHHILAPDNGSAIRDAWLLEELLGFFDDKTIQPMLLERSGSDPGATTPLSLWLRQGGWSRRILEILLTYSEGKDLEIMNGAGDYPLHQVVGAGSTWMVQTMVDLNPSLLHRENAVGLTPLELANNGRLRSQLDSPPSVSTVPHRTKVEDQDPANFRAKSGERSPTLLEVCNETALARPQKRKLVSLFDANEVAKRLASKQNQNLNRRDESRNKPGDEVSEWFGTAAAFTNHELEELEKKKKKTRSDAPSTSDDD